MESALSTSLSFNYILIATAVLMLVCLLSSKVSSYINMPCLLLFLAVGLICGPDGWFKIKTLSVGAKQANCLGTAAMAFILFSGGYDTSWKSIKSVFATGGILSSLGVLLTALFTGTFVWALMGCILKTPLDFSWCLLLGSIISSTDAAAVFAILRSKSVSLRGKLQPLLEFESGSNDPMAAFLTVFMVGLIAVETKNAGLPAEWSVYMKILPLFLQKMLIGVAAGYLLGRGAVWLYNKINFDYNGLYYALGIVMVILTYSLTEIISGNGFMAVYVAGIVMGNNRFVFHNGLGRFYDGMAWVMQVLLFSILGLMASPKKVLDAAPGGLIVALFLMVIARPLATFLCMTASKFNFRERMLVSWVGLRGGAPIMLATFPLIDPYIPKDQAQMLFHIVFFIVLSSVLIQGMTIMPLAKLLKLDAPLRKNLRVPLSFEETGDSSSVSCEMTVSQEHEGLTMAQLKLPEGALVLLIRRDEKFIIPRGDTRLQENDVLTVMGTPEAVQKSREKLRAKI